MTGMLLCKTGLEGNFPKQLMADGVMVQRCTEPWVRAIKEVHSMAQGSTIITHHVQHNNPIPRKMGFKSISNQMACYIGARNRQNRSYILHHNTWLHF
jgi:hypothetical protein